jgi:hypothetical protein
VFHITYPKHQDFILWVILKKICCINILAIIKHYNTMSIFFWYCICCGHEKWVPITKAWCILRVWTEEQPVIQKVTASVLNEQSQKTTRAVPPAWGLGKALTTPQCKNWPVTQQIHVPQAWSDPLVRPKQWRRNIGFCIWNVRTLYRSGPLTTVARELARYKLDLVDI